MKNKILICINFVLLFIYVFVRSFENKTSFFHNGSNYITIKDVETNVIDTIEMEDYIVGVIAGEMPASFDIEALKAQAVAARTYAYYKKQNSKEEYNLTTDSKTQVYLTEEQMKNKWGIEYDYYRSKVEEAVKATKNEVIFYKDEIIPAYYFSMSNGYTENALSVFNEDRNYLTTVVSKEDVNNRNYQVTTTFSSIDFCSKLNIKEPIVIGEVVRNQSNRVEKIVINNKVFSGIEFRKLLGLRSTDFTVDIANNILITTYGYGHGVGMSQYGANTMAKEGYNYKEILEHYYTDVSIRSINL